MVIPMLDYNSGNVIMHFGFYFNSFPQSYLLNFVATHAFARIHMEDMDYLRVVIRNVMEM
jgi:hypothetical protein